MASLRPVVLSGPSGAGKSTLLKMLTDTFPNSFAFSVSHTSRKPRPGEINGRDYHFVSTEDMIRGIEEGKYIEYAQFAGNYYGTPRDAVLPISSQSPLTTLFPISEYPLMQSLVSGLRSNLQSAMMNFNSRYQGLGNGRICLLDVDANGVRNIHSTEPSLNARFIFIGPPSVETLERRLRARGTETEEKIQSRLHQAKVDIDFALSPEGKRIYDAHIINDDVQKAYERLFAILRDDIASTMEPPPTSDPSAEEPQAQMFAS